MEISAEMIIQSNRFSVSVNKILIRLNAFCHKLINKHFDQYDLYITQRINLFSTYKKLKNT